MGRSIQILSVVLLLTLASAVRAQTPLTCGIVGIDGQTEVEAGMPLRFKARITGMGHITKPEFKWTVSAGTIATGQGTDEITSGYILMSAGQVTFEKEADERLARAKSYLVDVRDIDGNQIITIDCGFSQELNLKLYIAPFGANPPPCSSPEVPLAEVKFTKPRPESAKKRH